MQYQSVNYTLNNLSLSPHCTIIHDCIHVAGPPRWELKAVVIFLFNGTCISRNTKVCVYGVSRNTELCVYTCGQSTHQI